MGNCLYALGSAVEDSDVQEAAIMVDSKHETYTYLENLARRKYSTFELSLTTTYLRSISNVII